MRPVIKKVLLGVHMGLGHDGLSRLIKKQLSVNVKELKQGELILCLNTHGDKMKIIGWGGLVVGYLRLPEKRRIMREALRYLPQTFGAGGFDYDKASLMALNSRFETYPVVRKRDPHLQSAIGYTQ